MNFLHSMKDIKAALAAKQEVNLEAHLRLSNF